MRGAQRALHRAGHFPRGAGDAGGLVHGLVPSLLLGVDVGAAPGRRAAGRPAAGKRPKAAGIGTVRGIAIRRIAIRRIAVRGIAPRRIAPRRGARGRVEYFPGAGGIDAGRCLGRVVGFRFGLVARGRAGRRRPLLARSGGACAVALALTRCPEASPCGSGRRSYTCSALSPSHASASGGRVNPSARSSPWVTSWEALCQRSWSRSPRRVWCLSPQASTTRASAVWMSSAPVSSTHSGL